MEAIHELFNELARVGGNYIFPEDILMAWMAQRVVRKILRQLDVDIIALKKDLIDRLDKFPTDRRIGTPAMRRANKKGTAILSIVFGSRVKRVSEDRYFFNLLSALVRIESPLSRFLKKKYKLTPYRIERAVLKKIKYQGGC